MASELLLNVFPASRLPGSLVIRFRPPAGMAGVVGHDGRVEAIPTGGEGLVAGLIDMALGHLHGRWAASVPAVPVAVPVTMRLNANDGLADVTFTLAATIPDPAAFARWVRERGQDPETGAPLPYSVSDLREAIVNAVDAPLQARARRYLANDLEQPAARSALWAVVEGALKLPAQRWGVDFGAPTGKTVYVEPERAVVARMERAAELQSRLDELAQDRAIADAQREAETQEILTTIRSEFGEAAEAATEAALAPSPAPRQRGQIESLLDEFRAAFDARIAREVSRRAADIRQRLDADLAPKPEPKPAPRRPPLDPAQALGFVRFVLSLVSLALTGYFGWAQFQAMRLDGSNQVSYARELVASLGAFIGSLGGLTWLHRVLRARLAPPALPAPAGPVGMTLRERADYDAMVRGQVRRELGNMSRSVADAAGAAMTAGRVDDAVNLRADGELIQRISNRVEYQDLGKPAYLVFEVVAPETLTAMLDLDEKLLEDTRAATVAAETTHAAARAGGALQASRADLGARLLGIESLLRERERVDPALKAARA